MQCSVRELRMAGTALTDSVLLELMRLMLSNVTRSVTDRMLDPKTDTNELVRLQMHGHTAQQFAGMVEFLAELPTMGKKDLIDVAKNIGVTFTDEEDDDA